MTTSTPIDAIQALVSEIDVAVRRMKRDKQPDAAQVHGEMIDTLLPLLKELAMATAQEMASTQQYLQEEVEPLLQEALGETSALLPEDAELIGKRLVSYQQILASMIEQADAGTPPERLQQMKEELAATTSAIELVTELTIAEEEPGEGEEAEEEEEEAEAE